MGDIRSDYFIRQLPMATSRLPSSARVVNPINSAKLVRLTSAQEVATRSRQIKKMGVYLKHLN